MQPVWLTLWLMLYAVVIAVPLGMAMAVAASCCGSGKIGRWIQRFFIVAMLCTVALPMYLHAAGWESTAGKFGWLPLLQTTGRRFWFSGFFATAWIHGVTGAAWVGLATAWGMSRVSRRLVEVAAMEATLFRGIRAVILPLALPGIAAGTLWVALLAATEMTVADLYGVRTLADLVYLRYAYDPEPLGIALACLAPALVAIPLLFFLMHLSRQVAGDEGHRRLGWLSSLGRPSGTLYRGFPLLVVAGAVVLILIVPLFSLFVKAGWEVTGWEVTDPSGQLARDVPLRYGWSPARFATTISDSFQTFSAEYRWTTLLAITTAIPAVALGWIAAAWADRSPLFARLALAGAIVLVLLPGPVVGMFAVQFFHGRGDWLGWMYTQTLIPTICGQLVRAGPASYLVIRAGYRTLDRTVADAAIVDGATLVDQLFRLDAPRLVGTFFVAGAVAAIVATADVPASLIILPPSVTTVGTRMFELLHSGVRYQESGLAIGFCLAFAGLTAVIGGFVSWRARVNARRFV